MPLRARIKHLAHQLVRLRAYFRNELELRREFGVSVDALRTRSAAEINSTAVHEAGHAVSRLAFGLELVFVSIIPDPRDGTLGHVSCRKDAVGVDLNMVGRQAFFLQQAMGFYAGAEAVRQLIPTDPNPDAGATSDQRRAAELIIHEIGGNAEYVDFLFSLARRRCAMLVAHYQPEIKALAAALKENLILSGEVAREVFLKSLAKRSGKLMTFQTDHTFHGLIGDVAFRAFLRKMKLPGEPH